MVARMTRSAIREGRSHAFPVFRFAAYGLRFLVSTVLRENPYLGYRNKTGMHSHAGSLSTVARMKRSAIRESQSHALPVFRSAAYGLHATCYTFSIR